MKKLFGTFFKKHIICGIILCAGMYLFAWSATIPVSPASDFKYELTKNGDGVRITGYTGGKYCHIPAEIEGLPVTELGSYAFSYSPDKDHIETIIMPDTIKTVGEKPFDQLIGLKTVKLSSSLEAIPNGMFSGCYLLREITIPRSVKSIGDWAFSSTGIKTIEIPSTVKKYGRYILSGCEDLENVTLPPYMENLPDGTFYRCTSLKTVQLPEGIKEISEDLFRSCKALTSVKIPSSVTKICEDAFWACSSLRALEIPNSVKTIEKNAFSWSGLETLEIPDSVKELNCSFARCRSLKKIKLPNSVTVIKYDMFNDLDYSDVHTESLESITLPSSLESIDGFGYDKFGNLKEVIIPESIKRLTFGGDAFRGTSLTLKNQKQLRDLGYKGSFK